MREFSGAWMRNSGDFWGGLAAMLVTLPASVAFGVTVYSTIGHQFAAFGVLAGILGSAALGIIASTFGGTDRLITAPCAPAAVVLTAFTIQLTSDGMEPVSIVLMITVLGILSGLIQVWLGFMNIGGLIRYVPYPVVSGFLGGVGLITIGSQIPEFLGMPPDMSWFGCLLAVDAWDWRSITIGVVTIATLFVSPRFVKSVPGTILGLAAGCAAYAMIAVLDPSMRQLENNALVVGPLGATGHGYVALISDRWRQIGELRLSQVAALIGSALTLAALLSIDTLKTSVVLDRMTRSQHDPNRELTAQGFSNIVASAIGGMPGAGMMGASLINLSSGGKTRISGIAAGALTLIAALVFGSFIAWIPVAALGGLLIVVGIRMIDIDAFRLLESRSTVLDFCVVLLVVVVSLFVHLIAAAAAGVVLSILLFLREQVGGSVIRRKSFVAERSSTWVRSETEMRILEQKKESGVIYELQGSLFFGTAYQLYLALKPELEKTEYLILDMQRVQSIDVTAAQTLIQARDVLAERGAPLLLSNIRGTPSRNFREFLDLSGLTSEGGNVIIEPTLEAAIEWVEKRLIGEASASDEEAPPLELPEIGLFRDCKPDTLEDLEANMEKRRYQTGEVIFSLGDSDTNLYFVRAGRVNLMGYVGGSSQPYHVTTHEPGEFFGGLSFLDKRPRDNDAVALTDVECYVLSPEKLALLASEHRRTAFVLATHLAEVLAVRLRHASSKLKLLEEN
ncbi:MAG: cyclic nucleotide-binding domain-containing protein [Candidatus Accumulibacter sp.]|jgi:SulP family sulfate permease|nr:cyclic nucleotide-binding domain-containing protein [Accumulibacter sp.]